MAGKKKVAPVDPFQEFEQRLGKLEDQILDLDEGVENSFGDHDLQLEGLREDLIGRDKAIWVILDHHNARIAEIKRLLIPPALDPTDDPEFGGEIVSNEEGAPTWFVILVLLGFATLAGVVLYGLMHIR
jgi:hypothetical protein